jgi:hypothetical protein
MDLIDPKYLKGGFRFYLFDIIDVETHFAGVYPILNKSAESITTCVINFGEIFKYLIFCKWTTNSRSEAATAIRADWDY